MTLPSETCIRTSPETVWCSGLSTASGAPGMLEPSVRVVGTFAGTSCARAHLSRA